MFTIATPAKKSQHDIRSCVVVNAVYMLKIYITHYYHGVIGILKTEISNKNNQNRGSGEKSNRTYETYKNEVMTHGCHIYDK